MKNNLSILLLLFISLSTFAQDFEMPKHYVGRNHRGFFLSMALGVNNTSINVDSKNYGFANYSGPGAAFDLKIGGTISENLILHATILSHSVTGPKVDSDDWGVNDFKTDNKVSISQGIIGAGLTYYTAYNFLLSGSMGFGGLSFTNEREDLSFSTDNGFSFQLKAGKEWWVGPKWGIGVAVYYHNINLVNQKGNDAEEKINSHNFGIVFNATLNGRK